MTCIAHPVEDHPMFAGEESLPGRYLVTNGPDVYPVVLWDHGGLAGGECACGAQWCPHLTAALGHQIDSERDYP